MKKHLPNMVTCCNLLSGAMAIVCAFSSAYAYAFLFIIIGALFDFCDGALARKLGVSGPLGVQLDSLADDITFGLAPAIILYRFLLPQLGLWALLALLMAAFSALRLAKFNIDERQHESFIGLATPANAIFWASICAMPIWAETNEVFCTPGNNLIGTYLPWALLMLSFVSCYLLVSEIPMLSLKFKSFDWATNRLRYIFLIGAVLLIAFCVIMSAIYGDARLALLCGAATILWYVVFNIAKN